jgi:hypothetical protein
MFMIPLYKTKKLSPSPDTLRMAEIPGLGPINSENTTPEKRSFFPKFVWGRKKIALDLYQHDNNFVPTELTPPPKTAINQLRNLFSISSIRLSDFYDSIKSGYTSEAITVWKRFQDNTSFYEGGDPLNTYDLYLKKRLLSVITARDVQREIQDFAESTGSKKLTKKESIEFSEQLLLNLLAGDITDVYTFLRKHGVTQASIINLETLYHVENQSLTTLLDMNLPPVKMDANNDASGMKRGVASKAICEMTSLPLPVFQAFQASETTQVNTMEITSQEQAMKNLMLRFEEDHKGEISLLLEAEDMAKEKVVSPAVVKNIYLVSSFLQLSEIIQGKSELEFVESFKKENFLPVCVLALKALEKNQLGQTAKVITESLVQAYQAYIQIAPKTEQMISKSREYYTSKIQTTHEKLTLLEEAKMAHLLHLKEVNAFLEQEKIA